jgi:hypothetical protein
MPHFCQNYYLTNLNQKLTKKLIHNFPKASRPLLTHLSKSNNRPMVNYPRN